MYTIQQITSDTLQKQTLTLPDGTLLVIVMYFMPLQYGWVFREITYESFTLKNIRITNSPNILYQFKNQIPFGLACFSKDDREPTLQQDFASGNSKLYILSAEEVQQYSEFLSR
jgi:hypothetical protein